ncbi:MAG TPA: cache domain-containing protein, partial [Vicinamibacteria bacterium]|nr:cache domain-containing protein [Vicinamibacteria bacterium]
MGLTQKILLFTSVLVVALVASSLVFTTVQANRLAEENVTRGLGETRQVWETFQADRYNKLKLGIRVLGNDPFFKSLVETKDAATILDTLKERNEEIKADFFIVTDPAGMVVARTDRPAAQSEDLSKAPIVMKPLEGEESATVWRTSDRLYHAVSVPMVTGGELKGVLVAGYGINEALASQIRKLTHSEIAFVTAAPGAPPQLSVSSLGPKEAALRAALGRPELASGSAEEFEIDLAGEQHVGIEVPLKTATGETVGALMALRSKDAEMAAFRRFRNSLIMVSAAVMVLGLLVAYLGAARITGPVRRLADLV